VEIQVTASGPGTGGEASVATVWIVEDNALYRRELAALLNASRGLSCPLAVPSCEEALYALDEGMVPDIVLMDIGLPGMSGIEGARRIRGVSPAARIVMLTVHQEDAKVFDAVCAGASGYLLKPAPADEIVEAVRDVLRGAAPMNGYIAKKVLDMFSRLPAPRAAEEGYGLTEREKEILTLLVDGLTMREIAERLDLSYHTIDTHLRNIYGKLHVRSRSGAVAKALKERLL
jgi:DNA-binding NarL/FixJ family response regulator